MPRSLTIVALFILLTILLTGMWWQSTLKSPYPAIKEIKSLPFDKKAECPNPPPPLHDMLYGSIYTDKSNGASNVDPAAQEKYNEQIHDIKKFEIQISKWIETLRISPQQNSETLSCTVQWLQNWAQNRSLLVKDRLSENGHWQA